MSHCICSFHSIFVICYSHYVLKDKGENIKIWNLEKKNEKLS